MSLDSEGKGHTVLFKKSFYYEYTHFLCYGCFACVCLVPAESELELQTVENLDVRMGIEPRSSARGVSPPNHWLLPSAPMSIEVQKARKQVLVRHCKLHILSGFFSSRKNCLPILHPQPNCASKWTYNKSCHHSVFSPMSHYCIINYFIEEETVAYRNDIVPPRSNG